MATSALFLHTFKTDISEIKKPEKFTFPFCYEPHPLSKIAATELQEYLETQDDFVHNFGLTAMDGLIIGKMFGVLVVETPTGELAYLAACSGKLAGSNQHRYLVPPIFDMLQKNSFFILEEEEINKLNRTLGKLENDVKIPLLQKELKELEEKAASSLRADRHKMKEAKAARKQSRDENKPILSEEAYKILEEDLVKQSYRDQHEHAVLKTYWKQNIQQLQDELHILQHEIESLRALRKEKSSNLQRRLFDQYQFLNAKGQPKSVLQIFNDYDVSIPPAGAGECAAPKLLQYAYANNLFPVCIAEFWWGASPASEIRRHKTFYPACKSKCEPILTHMLDGLVLDQNPMLENPAEGKDIEIIFEDDDIVVVNKPSEFLSVPGINIKDSVQHRIMERFPYITGPIIIHRLDMSTSGILVLAKHKDAHQFIQDQFIKHTIKKRYTALLDGQLATKEGEINLPIRVDLDDRPRQMVCYEYGKPAQTLFKVVSKEGEFTRVHFFPQTGRTHQLRVHAAHSLGLNHPIVGDDLYGTRAERLHLHAGFIEFVHPRSKSSVSFTVEDPF
ncbi:pseudouridine synthase [Sphingobacterium sp. LRF_L2]|uniref:RluA family pseudouridine synthase n=1 Tax=Sphingobacterium sp. LRF_L2 TaxID=3369421 RepID=UPI003F618387